MAILTGTGTLTNAFVDRVDPVDRMDNVDKAHLQAGYKLAERDSSQNGTGTWNFLNKAAFS